MSWLDRTVDRLLERSRQMEREDSATEPMSPASTASRPGPHNVPAYLAEFAAPLRQSYLRQLAGSKLRATELLFRVLPEAEVLRYLLYGVVLVAHESGGYYEIKPDHRSNVTYHDADGRARIHYCAMPGGGLELEVEDVIAAQYLALRYNRDDFMKVANRQLAL